MSSGAAAKNLSCSGSVRHIPGDPDLGRSRGVRSLNSRQYESIVLAGVVAAGAVTLAGAATNQERRKT
jgi:hypothetical protein